MTLSDDDRRRLRCRPISISISFAAMWVKCWMNDKSISSWFPGVYLPSSWGVGADDARCGKRPATRRKTAANTAIREACECADGILARLDVAAVAADADNDNLLLLFVTLADFAAATCVDCWMAGEFELERDIIP